MRKTYFILFLLIVSTLTFIKFQEEYNKSIKQKNNFLSEKQNKDSTQYNFETFFEDLLANKD